MKTIFVLFILFQNNQTSITRFDSLKECLAVQKLIIAELQYKKSRQEYYIDCGRANYKDNEFISELKLPLPVPPPPE